MQESRNGGGGAVPLGGVAEDVVREVTPKEVDGVGAADVVRVTRSLDTGQFPRNCQDYSPY